MCKEVVGWLDPIFQQWGPYMQFFDRLIPLLAKKPDLRDKVITVKEGMDKVKIYCSSSQENWQQFRIR